MAAIVIFALVARLAIWLLPHGLVRKIVVVIDDVVLIGLLLYFGYEMFVYLWNRKPPLERGTAATFGHVADVAGLLPLRTLQLDRIVHLLARILDGQ